MLRDLILHCGGHRVTLDELKRVPTPPKTASYTPVSFYELVALAMSRLKLEFGSKAELGIGIGLNKLGLQMFAVIAVLLNGKRGPAFGLRSSHDLSLRAAFCGGEHVVVCDNLLFHADFLNYARRHVGDAWEDLQTQIITGAAKMQAQFGLLDAEAETLEMTRISQRDGYEFLGNLVGERVLSPVQATLAFQAWRKPEYSEFEPRNAWSLANSANVGLKTGAPGTLLRKHTQLHTELGYRFLGVERPLLAVPDEEPLRDDDDDDDVLNPEEQRQFPPHAIGEHD